MLSKRNHQDLCDSVRSKEDYEHIVQHRQWDFERERKPQKQCYFYIDSVDEQGYYDFYKRWVGRQEELFDMIEDLMDEERSTIRDTLVKGICRMDSENDSQKFKWFSNAYDRCRSIHRNFIMQRCAYLRKKYHPQQKTKKATEGKEVEQKPKKQGGSWLSSIKKAFSSIKTAFRSSSPSETHQIKDENRNSKLPIE